MSVDVGCGVAVGSADMQRMGLSRPYRGVKSIDSSLMVCKLRVRASLLD